MVRKQDKAIWKSNYFLRLLTLLEEYPRCFLVSVDHVGSKQMQQIRCSLRGSAEILMGKNTMIRKAIRGHLAKNPSLEKLLPHIIGNVGFVFTKEDLCDIKEKILSNKVAAPAKAGTIAPIDVQVQAHNTGLGPEKTNFFQALNMPTKITRGTIEILNSVTIIKQGEKVGASEAALLQMLNVKPFSYGLVIRQVYDSGTIFDPAILDITDEQLRDRFLIGVRNIAALSLAINYPTMASAPHSLANGLKNLLALAVETDITFREAQNIKEILADPEKFAALAATATQQEKAGEPTEEAPQEAEEDSEEEDFGFGLFD